MLRLGFYTLAYLGVLVGLCAKNYIADRSLYKTMVALVENRVEHFLFCGFLIFLVYLAALSAVRLFVGKLTSMEGESVQENCLRFLADICLVITLFADEISLRGLVLFSVVLAMKVLHWILGLRIETLEKTGNLTPTVVAKTYLFAGLLLVLGVFLAVRTVVSAVNTPSASILFGFEFSILVAYCIKCLYILSVVLADAQAPVEDKASLIFYGDFVYGAFKIVSYILCLVWTTQHFRVPLNLLREAVLTAKSLVVKTRTFLAYRTLVKELSSYPDHKKEDIPGDKTCLICHEDMDVAKKLDCGHLFHFLCLREWLDRQQACPVCRKEILTKDAKKATGKGDELSRDREASAGYGPGNSGIYFRTETDEFEGIPVARYED